MIINIRGTNGAGKTSVYRRFIDDHPGEELFGPTPRLQTDRRYVKPIAFALPGGTFCVGRHQAGCDGIHPQEIIVDLVRHYAALGHVVYENVLISGNRGRWEAMARDLEPTNHTVWAVLDTPFATCLERIYQRRALRAAEGWKHRGATIKEGLIEQQYRRVHRVSLGAVGAGIDVRLIDHTRAYEQTHDLLVRAGWDCGHGLLLPEEGAPPPYSELPSDGGFDRVRTLGGRTAPAPPHVLSESPTFAGMIPVDEEWDVETWE